jgi:hypothetical protein
VFGYADAAVAVGMLAAQFTDRHIVTEPGDDAGQAL